MNHLASPHTNKSDQEHIPVMCKEVVEHLAIRDGGVYVDATFGIGGYSRAILETADCKVIGIDRDPRAVALGYVLENEAPGRFAILEGVFGSIAEMLTARGISSVDGICFDLGVSSPQIDDPARGFSFRFEGPLDMRMGRDGLPASHLVNTMEEGALAELIFKFGEERMAKRIARAIVKHREKQPITTTQQLADIVRAVVHHAPGCDPAARTFQALRIAVNDELGELERGLHAANKLLKPGGRLVVVSFHSLEDRIVKNFIRKYSANSASGNSRHLPERKQSDEAYLAAITQKPLQPSKAEVHHNPRSSSAKLRAAERLHVNTQHKTKGSPS